MIRTNDIKMVGLSRAFVLIPLLLLALALAAPVAVAQATEADVDPYPLRPADTSSPRATLRSFLTNANEAIADWHRNSGKLSAAGLGAYDRAEQTLDFSTTPDRERDGPALTSAS